MDQQQSSNVVTIRWSGKEYKTWIELVGPVRAQAVLDTDEGANRKIRKERVARYAADLRRGKWRLTGEPVRLDEEGRLLNGQHRLTAIAQSGCEAPMMFVSGISKSTRMVQDTGLPPTQADWMPLEDASASVRIVRSVLRSFYPTLASSASRDEILDVYNIIGDAHMRWCIESTTSKVARRAPLRAALVVMHRINPQRARLFAKRMSEHDLPGGTPESSLDRALTDRGKLHPDQECGLAMRCAYSALKDNDRGVSKLYVANTEQLTWLVRAAKLDPILVLRRRPLSVDDNEHEVWNP